jgi:hypothetical protein
MPILRPLIRLLHRVIHSFCGKKVSRVWQSTFCKFMQDSNALNFTGTIVLYFHGFSR